MCETKTCGVEFSGYGNVICRRKKRATGFSLYELVIVIALLGVVSAFLLDRLAYYQEVAEKAYFEYIVSALRNSLRTHVATLMIEGRFQESSLLVGKNPMCLLDAKPDNYLGELPPLERDRIVPGSWYFDAGDKTLVYIVRAGRSFENPLGDKTVRLKLVRTKEQTGEVNEAGIDQGIQLRAVTPYSWH